MAQTSDEDAAAGIGNPEAFARNLARLIEEAGRAAANYLGPRETGKAADGFDGFEGFIADAVRTLTRVGEYWTSKPERAVQAQNRLLAGYLGIGLAGHLTLRLAGTSMRAFADHRTCGKTSWSRRLAGRCRRGLKEFEGNR